MKKLIALVLALALVLACCSVAFAADDGSVTVDNAVPGETYNIYKLFDLTYSGSDEISSGTEGGDTAKSGVSYSFTKTTSNTALYSALVASSSPFTLTPSTTTDVYNVSSSANADTISAWMKTNQSLLPSAGEAKVAPAAAEGKTTSTVSWTGLPYGYYYVTSTVGSLVTIDSTLKAVVVKDKNPVPGLDKTITGVKEGETDKSTSNISDAGKKANAKIGDVITYTVVIHAKKGAENYVFHDTLSAGLTLGAQSDLTVSAGDGNYTVQYWNATKASGEAATGDVKANDNITIRFTKAYLDTIHDDTDITITYKATVNDAAVIASTGNPNDSYLEYGHTPTSDTTPGSDTDHSSSTVYTYGIALVKVDEQGNRLPNATFTFPFYFKATAETDGSYVFAGVDPTDKTGLTNTFTTTTENSAQITIKGLQQGTEINITETSAPNGYNKLTTTVDVTPELLSTSTTTKTWKIKDGVIVADSVETTTTVTYTNNSLAVTPVMVINHSGTELPSTGGIGTTIFYILGGLLVVGAAVILVARRKASN